MRVDVGLAPKRWGDLQGIGVKIRGLCGFLASVGTVKVVFVGLITSNSTCAASCAWQLRLCQVLVHAVIILCKLK